MSKSTDAPAESMTESDSSWRDDQRRPLQLISTDWPRRRVSAVLMLTSCRIKTIKSTSSAPSIRWHQGSTDVVLHSATNVCRTVSSNSNARLDDIAQGINSGTKQHRDMQIASPLRRIVSLLLQARRRVSAKSQQAPTQIPVI